jgi:hypothetical protein
MIMEAILRPIYQERASQPNTLGVLMIEKGHISIPSTDTFDAVLLIIVKEAEKPVYIKHYTFEEQKAAMHVVTEEKLRDWIMHGTNRKIFDWIYNGKILFDRNEYVQQLKTELEDFPFYDRKIKMGIEFAKLIRRYMDGKAFFEKKHHLDAYNHVIHSLHHLARLAVIENGFHPEVTVWEQVKKINPEIYKLYEELVSSEEPLEKRLELLFLASEFMIHAKTEAGISHLVGILKQKEYWTFDEIMSQEEIDEYSVDLGMLLEYLIEKGIIKVKKVETKGKGIFHRYYMLP